MKPIPAGRLLDLPTEIAVEGDILVARVTVEDWPMGPVVLADRHDEGQWLARHDCWCLRGAWRVLHAAGWRYLGRWQGRAVWGEA